MASSRLSKVAALGCLVCRQHMGVYTPALVHHLKGLKYSSLGKKADDENTIPLCVHHHTGFLGIHTIGMHKWEDEFGKQEDYLAITNRLIGEMH